MNNVILSQISTKSNGTLTISSREVAELTGKKLNNVHRDIRAMLDSLYGDDSDLNHDGFQGVMSDKDSRGYVTCYHLDKLHAMTLLTGYDVKARHRVMQRLEELEHGNIKTRADYLLEAAIRFKEQETAILLLEQQQAETEQRISELVGGDDYVTVKGFARTNKKPADRETLKAIGKRAAAICRMENISIGKVRDENWGEVNSYPREIVARSFDSLDI